METIKIKPYPKFKNDTFIVVLPSNNFHSVGSKFQFLEYGNENFIIESYLVSKRQINFDDLTSEISFLDKNCELELYKTILKAVFFYVKDLSILNILTFTKECNIITELDIFNKIPQFKNPRGSVPNHKIIPKKYIYDSNADYSQAKICPTCNTNKLRSQTEQHFNQCLECQTTIL